MKSTIVLPLLFGLIFLILTGCDTPWAAAKRDREGITWQEWQQGIRSKEDKGQARIASQMREEKEVQEWLERRRKYVADNPNLPKEIAQAIVNGRLARGMTENHVALAWAAAVPDRVNTSTGAWGERKQCVYELSSRLSRSVMDKAWTAETYYLYFQNGRLDSWQSSR